VPAGKSPMCGNTICQDRRFMARGMPKLEAFFTIATSTCRR
jgi:oligoribonuclease